MMQFRNNEKSEYLGLLLFHVISPDIEATCLHGKYAFLRIFQSKETSVQFSHSVVSSSLRPHGLQHARLPCPSQTPEACSNSPSFESVMPSNHLILCRPLLLLPWQVESLPLLHLGSSLISWKVKRHWIPWREGGRDLSHMHQSVGLAYYGRTLGSSLNTQFPWQTGPSPGWSGKKSKLSSSLNWTTATDF